ncbi:MAG: class I mannose-6-phosphate isomerase [Deltaproteobacteria bacterium]|nr:class I mannose-6-phosphate isomerase [Deltaproteobacteria bacterium]
MTLRPLLLRPDNFTPATRTPWGGTKILRDYKRGLPIAADKRGDDRVGESWEISVEPDFPSVAELPGGGEMPLARVLADDPVGWLGEDHARRYHGSTPLLVKLLDAADDLSVQIHPTDDYAGLASGESGKPESWLVLDAEQGCGLYLGLAAEVNRREVERALASGGDLAPLMTFVPVVPGDFFRIDAGTVHAIGRGVTLVEPQFVAPGRRGVTYRFWDWNRRYDAHGQIDPRGKPRALHVEHALAVTRWDGPRGEAFVESIRVREDGTSHQVLAHTPHLRVERVRCPAEAGSPVTVEVDLVDRMTGITVTAGQLEIVQAHGEGRAPGQRVSRGRSAVVPAALRQVALVLHPGTEACVTAAGP